ncbi:MAG: PAS domain-containing protein, partial [Desulfatitalea sp.]|nr:PAS domain-containing protein [Desulfatitalea sp.]NNK01676.1 PAS domain-containing protein [Desulfatitalea sp.]
MADQTTSFHEQLINAIPVPLFFKDRQGRFMGFNAAFASFIGRPRETLIGKTAFDLVPADVAEIYLAKDEELFANGGVQQYEAQLKNARGDLHDVIFRKAVFHNQTGEIDGLVGILLDITGQKQAELEIAAGRERLRRVIDTSKNCVAVKDEHGRYLLANDALAELVGSSKEAMIGKTDRDFIAMGRIQTPQEEMFTANDDKVIETGQTLSSEKVPFTSPDGTKRWFKTVKAPISFPNHPRSMLMIATDISDLHKANESLRNMELRLSTMLDVQPNLVVLLDPEQRILWANKAACKTSGLEREGLIGRRCHEVLHHSGACPDCPMPQAVQARRPVTETIQSPDNKIWRVTSAPVFDGNGHLVQTVDVAEDITEHLAMEGHLKRSQRLEAIGTLAAGIAHDFNNILSAILGFNDLAMESASFYPDIRENLEEVANAGRRARNLVAQILAFSRQTGTEKGPVPIHLIVKEILQLLRATFPSTIDIRKQIDTYGVI